MTSRLCTCAFLPLLRRGHRRVHFDANEEIGRNFTVCLPCRAKSAADLETNWGFQPMDTFRGYFSSDADYGGDAAYLERGEEETGHDGPSASIGRDERRMQVRAYNHWASLLGDRNFPCIEDLDPENLPDFGPYSVLLDFTSGIENPGIAYLGDMLATECGAQDETAQLSDVPSPSLLSRITDHYMQILANQAPIGFEAEFVNQLGKSIAYRGILLPFSTDDDSIDFIYGVINWKELADQLTTDELLLEIDQALERDTDEPVAHANDTPLTDWADGPVAHETAQIEPAEDILDLTDAFGGGDDEDASAGHLPAPSFGGTDGFMSDYDAGSVDDEDDGDAGDGGWAAGAEADAPADRAKGPVYGSLLAKFSAVEPESDEFDTEEDDEEGADWSDEGGVDPEVTHDVTATGAYDPDQYQTDLPIADAGEPIALAMPEEDEMELGDWLASARELAMAARSSEDRSRQALYAAIGRAYDFSIAAADQPEDFAELVTDSGLTIQDRAPMTPVVKLVFGADYDKTRLTEYAAALSHGHRLGVERGGMEEFLCTAKGGLKGVVNAERRLRREEAGQPVEPEGAPRERLARKLRSSTRRISTQLSRAAANLPWS